MGADVADGGADAGASRVQPPLGLSHAEFLVRGGQEVLQVLDNDLAHPPHLSRTEQRARLPDHGMAGVVVGQGKDQARFLDDVYELLGLFQRVSHGLVADDVDAGLQERAADVEMGDVGSDDADEVNALIGGKVSLGGGHFGVRVVNPARVQVKLGARFAVEIRVARKHPGHHLGLLLHGHDHPMHRADKRPRAAADHAHPQLAIPRVHWRIPFGRTLALSPGRAVCGWRRRPCHRRRSRQRPRRPRQSGAAR